MGAHLIDGEFQSDKYPTTPVGKVPLSVKDPTAQDLLAEYARRRRSVDPEFSADLETALRNAGYTPPSSSRLLPEHVLALVRRWIACEADPFRDVGAHALMQAVRSALADYVRP